VSRLHEVAVVSRALVRGRRRRRAEPPPLARDVLERLRALLPPAAADTELVHVPADRPPWTPTAVDVRAGETITTLAVGRVHHSKLLDFWAGPHNQLWFRVAGAGPIFRGTRATHTFAAPGDGPLELASHPPGEWTDPGGTHASSPRDYRRVSGGLDVLVIRWAPHADSDAELEKLGGADPSGLVQVELDRRATAVSEPAGWGHLWHVGLSEIYQSTSEQQIECDTHADVGLLRRAVDFPLSDATRLHWSWRVDDLPSELAEDTLPTHDYMSIALEFDNGQDLTWYWSAELPAGTSYRCPIPTWREKETHLVVRSGRAGLGRWLSEERAVRQDYAAAVGPPPQRIVGVWLIALSLFQRGHGRCAYSGIELRDGERVERV
jgi:hypothetical protein